MSQLTEPLHVCTIAGHTFRFFRSPLAGPDFPWHAVDDLHACLALPRDLRRHFQRWLKNGPYKDDVRTVATADGIALIAPHFAAQGLLGAATELCAAMGVMSNAKTVDSEYCHAGGEALKKLMGDRPMQEVIAFAAAALKRH